MTEEAKKGGPALLWGWILVAGSCLVAVVPILGFGAWLIAGPVLFIALILGIVAISGGNTGGGVILLLVTLIVAPIFIFFAPIISSVVLGAAGVAAEDAAAEGHIHIHLAAGNPDAKVIQLTADKRQVDGPTIYEVQYELEPGNPQTGMFSVDSNGKVDGPITAKTD